MKISDRGLELIKSAEGFRSESYLCPAGIPTIGYGATYYPNGVKVTLDDKPIAKDEADAILRHMVNTTYGSAVSRYTSSKTTQNQFDALTSFAYNLGVGALQRSTLLKHHNEANHGHASNEFHKWVYAGGKKLRGLVRRRATESELYSKI